MAKLEGIGERTGYVKIDEIGIIRGLHAIFYEGLGLKTGEKRYGI